jgi:hypothetical protein
VPRESFGSLCRLLSEAALWWSCMTAFASEQDELNRKQSDHLEIAAKRDAGKQPNTCAGLRQ